MKRFARLPISAVCLLCILWEGCIKNDIPYPTIFAEITAIEVAGQTAAATINPSTQEVTLELADTVDLKHVRLLRFETTRESRVSPLPGEYIDLSSPLRLTLSIHQDYLWKIRAVQHIERQVEVVNQVGDAIIDVGNRGVLVNVVKGQPLDDIRIVTMVLGPSNSTVSPDPATIHDFTDAQTFTVRYHDVTEEWSVRIMHSETEISTGTANAWARFAYLNGSYAGNTGDPTFEYRLRGEEEWTTVPLAEVSTEGTSFSARITGLTPETEYEFRSVAGSSRGTEQTFVTEREEPIPNLSFDDWFQNGKVWYANKDMSDENYWWDSGNKGSTAIGSTNPTMPEDEIVVKGRAAALKSTSVLSVFAAGSLYLGQFQRVIGTSGAEISMGRPYTGRPTKLSGYINYTPGTIDKAKSPYESFAGKPDTCHIYMLLSDKEIPYTINTSKKQFIDFENDPNIIAFGDIQLARPTSGYEAFTIELAYRSLVRKPKYALIVAAASKYGDFFTGSTSSELYIDEFSLSFE